MTKQYLKLFIGGFFIVALGLYSGCGDSEVQRTNNRVVPEDVGDAGLDAIDHADVTDADEEPDVADAPDADETPDCEEGDLSRCESQPNAHAVACVEDECVYECDQGYSDDDGDLGEVDGNGCESGCVESNEVCDGVDNDCDGEIDEGCQCDDGDSYDCYTGPAGTKSVGACAAGAQNCEDGVMSSCQGEVTPAEEVCDGIDNDCDGEVDEEVLSTFYADSDGDGFGDPNDTIEACSAPDGYVDNSDDCDDTDADVHPDATEVCNEIDDNCDGSVDEGVENTFYADSDGDGFGDPNDTIEACSAPTGYVDNSDDCDDTDAGINPDASETCNGVDDDCDGDVDEDAKDTFYADSDGDGFGDPNDTTEACSAPTGYVDNSDDCDDSDAGINPDASETCNGVDDDCDGTVDNGVKDTFYADSDGDGYGDSGDTTQACSAPTGYVSDDTDCDDSDADKYPGNTEVCDGKDNDCDGDVDEGVKNTYYEDGDGDGFGDSGSTTKACSTPSGYVNNSDDCNDNNASINPDASEICNGTDDDCDGYVDEGVKARFYYDSDDDGYGVTNNYEDRCSQSGLYRATQDGDCDDSDADKYPGNTEVCDGKDNDCDGTVDEGVKNTYYRDADGDGYGNSSSTTKACSSPGGYVSNSTDCDDSDADKYPGNTEVCDGKDNDCDGTVDEGVKNTYYHDGDGDGYGDPNDSTQACSTPSNHVSNDGDCDDTDAMTYPGAPELCTDDTEDRNCNGLSACADPTCDGDACVQNSQLGTCTNGYCDTGSFGGGCTGDYDCGINEYCQICSGGSNVCCADGMNCFCQIK